MVDYENGEFADMTIETAEGEFTGSFSQFRINKESIPENMHVYELRHGDDDSIPCSIENSVVVNLYGTFISTTPIQINDFITINEWGFDS
jgi:hypothetical protein